MDGDRRRLLIVAGAVVAILVVIFAIVMSGDDDPAEQSTTTTTADSSGSSVAPPSTAPTALDFDRLANLSGVYVGQWDSAQFGDGVAQLAIDVNASTKTVAVDFGLEGQLLESLITQLAPTDGAVNVMGGVNAVFSDAATASGTGTLVGDYTVTLNADGEVSMEADDVPGPHVDGIDIAGTLQPDCFVLEYFITFEGTDTVFAGSIELCRTDDGGIIIGGGTAVPTQTLSEYTVEVLDQSANDPVDGVGMTMASVTFACADGRCDGSIAIGQIAYPDGTAQRGGFRQFQYDPATETYLFDETVAGACEQERWYGTITPTAFDDRGPTGFTLAGGHDGSGGCDYQLVYQMTGTRDTVSP